MHVKGEESERPTESMLHDGELPIKSMLFDDELVSQLQFDEDTITSDNVSSYIYIYSGGDDTCMIMHKFLDVASRQLGTN